MSHVLGNMSRGWPVRLSHVIGICVFALGFCLPHVHGGLFACAVWPYRAHGNYVLDGRIASSLGLGNFWQGCSAWRMLL